MEKKSYQQLEKWENEAKGSKVLLDEGTRLTDPINLTEKSDRFMGSV